MPNRRSSWKQSPSPPPSSSSGRKVVAIDTTTAEPLIVKPVKEVVTEQTEVTTEPELEIRRPATLAQVLIEPPSAVVKPKMKIRRRSHRAKACSLNSLGPATPTWKRNIGFAENNGAWRRRGILPPPFFANH